MLSKKQKKEIHALAIELTRGCPDLEQQMKKVGKTIREAHGD
jgi:hypothetical protein